MLTATPRGRIQSTCLVYRLSDFLSTLYMKIHDEVFFISQNSAIFMSGFN